MRAAAIRSSIEYEAANTLASRLAAWVRYHRVPLLTQYLERRAKIIQDAKYQFTFVDELPFNAIASTRGGSDVLSSS